MKSTSMSVLDYLEIKIKISREEIISYFLSKGFTLEFLSQEVEKVSACEIIPTMNDFLRGE